MLFTVVIYICNYITAKWNYKWD